nr:hypothetical protein [uncultured Desulfobulbus sp.]
MSKERRISLGSAIAHDHYVFSFDGLVKNECQNDMHVDSAYYKVRNVILGAVYEKSNFFMPILHSSPLGISIKKRNIVPDFPLPLVGKACQEIKGFLFYLKYGT